MSANPRQRLAAYWRSEWDIWVVVAAMLAFFAVIMAFAYAEMFS